MRYSRIYRRSRLYMRLAHLCVIGDVLIGYITTSAWRRQCSYDAMMRWLIRLLLRRGDDVFTIYGALGVQLRAAQSLLLAFGQRDY